MKKTLAITLALCGFYLFLGQAQGSDNENVPWKHVQFSTHEYSIKLFDQQEGKIYIYNEGDGKLVGVWQIEELGRNLKKAAHQ